MNVIHGVGLLLIFAGLPSVQAEPKAILSKAIEAAGGTEALQRARVLNWRGKATIYAGDRQVRLEGRWMVEPPDRASVATWEADKGEASTRRLIVNAAEGSMERDGKSMPMPPEILANERDQFYLYSILKLAPLVDPAFTLTAVAENGARGLNVQRAGRPDVKILFDATGRATHLLTTVNSPTSKERIPQELRFEGTVESTGVKWPRRIQIFQNGKLFMDLEILEFSVTQ